MVLLHNKNAKVTLLWYYENYLPEYILEKDKVIKNKPNLYYTNLNFCNIMTTQ